MSCVGCVDSPEGLHTLLADARASLKRSQVYLRPTIRPEPRQVTVLRERLAGLWHTQIVLSGRLQRGQNLGLAWMIPLVVGAGSVVAMLSAWALKHQEEAREVELRAELYDRMLQEGLSPERAAALAMGAESQFAAAIRTVTVLALVCGGLYFGYRVLK